jgi:hypothetical protein
MGKFQDLWFKARYSTWLRLVLDALSRVGIVIQPYYVVMEGLFGRPMPRMGDGLHEYEVGYLGPEDMKAVAAVPGRTISLESLNRRLAEGKKCFGIRKGGELAAFTWADLETLSGGVYARPLEPDEAYLFDAFTLVPFRGKGIAPYIRYLVYRELEKLGKTRLYSISLYVNTPSIRFKKKLSAKFLELRMYYRVFRRWEREFRIKELDG